MPSKLDPVTNWPQEVRKADYEPGLLAQNQGVSLRRLEQYFRKIQSESPKSYCRRLLLEDARVLVEQGVPIRHVSAQFQFCHVTYFIAVFRRQFGRSPRRHFCRAKQAHFAFP